MFEDKPSYDELYHAIADITNPADETGICEFCDANIERESHYVDCLWVKIANHPSGAFMTICRACGTRGEHYCPADVARD